VSSAVIVGAGVFGASLAWRLTAEGWAVTLVDRLEPGHVRASSGGESRLIRLGHAGKERWYQRSAARALGLWEEIGRESGVEVLVRAGIAWFARHGDELVARCEAGLREDGIAVERLEPAAAARMFPDLATDDLAYVLHEPTSGIVRARPAVRALVALARRRGAALEIADARPRGRTVALDDGRRLEADAVVWACGPWLGRLFPGVADVRSTRQELLFFGVPAAWRTPGVPGWVENWECYGQGDLDGRGFKVGVDRLGDPFDPDDGRREAAPDAESLARACLRRRFPSLADAPLVGVRVCQYEMTPDAHFLAAEHPEQDGVWLLGGGSGHGFKHGPALAEHMAAVIAGDVAPEPLFAAGPRSAQAAPTLGPHH
jgi:glycine/D-amino acid oxidase-like deaminating enzyme